MKYLSIALILLCLYSFTPSIEYIKIDLGKGFYYFEDSTLSEIWFLPSYEDTSTSISANNPKIVWPVIRNVESFGVNDNYIMATNKNNKVISYWIIDKTQDPNTIGAHEEGARIVLSNVTMIDSTKFISLRKKFDIDVRPKQYYKKKTK